MKKIIWFSASIICILIFCFLYFNSVGYRYKVATKLRDERISELDKIPRRYIKEGVYSFDYNRATSKNVKDKFGEWATVRNHYPLQRGEVSFTSKKITISLGTKIETFIISNPTIIGYVHPEEHFIKYEFKILNWTAYDGTYWVFQYDTMNNYKYRKIMKERFFEPVLTLDIRTSITNDSEDYEAKISIIEDVSGYDISDYDVNGERREPLPRVPLYYSDSPLPDEIDTDQYRFIFSMMRGPINMDKLNYEYSTWSNREPEYVRNAEYEKDEYDINIYLSRIKKGGYISNPFAIESEWK